VYAERRRRGIVGHASKTHGHLEPALRLAAAAGVLTAAAMLSDRGLEEHALAHAARVLGVSRQTAWVLRRKLARVVKEWRRP
jgi:hypothetical protein